MLRAGFFSTAGREESADTASRAQRKAVHGRERPKIARKSQSTGAKSARMGAGGAEKTGSGEKASGAEKTVVMVVLEMGRISGPIGAAYIAGSMVLLSCCSCTGKKVVAKTRRWMTEPKSPEFLEAIVAALGGGGGGSGAEVVVVL